MLTQCADARPCLAIPAHRMRCRILDDRDRMMGKKSKQGKGKDEKPTCDDRPVVEILEAELDGIIDRLMTGQEADDGRDPGRAEMAAYAIALIKMPYHPDMEIVRAEAMARYEERSAEDA